jgi:hypothetical protein
VVTTIYYIFVLIQAFCIPYLGYRISRSLFERSDSKTVFYAAAPAFIVLSGVASFLADQAYALFMRSYAGGGEVNYPAKWGFVAGMAVASFAIVKMLGRKKTS